MARKTLCLHSPDHHREDENKGKTFPSSAKTRRKLSCSSREILVLRRQVISYVAHISLQESVRCRIRSSKASTELKFGFNAGKGPEVSTVLSIERFSSWPFMILF